MPRIAANRQTDETKEKIFSRKFAEDDCRLC
jgi:hypothetical protein